MAGASSAIEDWIEPRIPLTRIRCWDGVICGTRADTAGIWTPAPAERTARADEDQPRLGEPREHDQGERERGRGDGRVGEDHEALAVVAVGPDAADERDEGLWQEPEHDREHHHHARLEL